MQEETKTPETENKESFMTKVKNLFLKILQVMWDSLKVLAGFPKNLFYKPKNMEEFKEGSRIGCTYMCFCMILIFIAAAITTFSGYGFLLLFIALGAIILVGWRLNDLASMQKQFQNLTCSTCQAMITYDESVRYNVLAQDWSVGSDSGKHPIKKGEEAENKPVKPIAWGVQVAHVQISCRCQKCGNLQNFDLDITTGRCEKEMYGVSPYAADQVAMQLEAQVRQVCHEVFDEHQYTQNHYGVKVKLYDLDQKVKNFFNV